MSLERNTAGDFPDVAEAAFVHETATLIGNVVVEDRVFIGPQAVLRADELGPDGIVHPIVIGEGANVQDRAVVHALGGTAVNIGPESSIAQGAVVQGPCQIGANCFIGFNTVVFKATLGDDVVVMHHSLVEGVTIPPGLHVPSMTPVRNEDEVQRLAPATTDIIAFATKVSQANRALAQAALECRFDEETSLGGDMRRG
ncbi:MAG: carbonate dehydratase [Pirellulaceae bacterium]|nr:carbonate dehydratase [Pirellulaceae bacterium]